MAGIFSTLSYANSNMNNTAEKASETTRGPDMDENVKTETYTIVTTLIMLLTVALLGAALNIALLLAARCKRNVRNLYFGLFFNISAVNTLFCLGWTPMFLAQLTVNYYGNGASNILCYVNDSLFQLLLAALVISVALLSVQRIVHLCRLSAQDTHYIALVGIIVSWLGAIVVAVSVAIDIPSTLRYGVCVLGSWPVTSLHDVKDSRASAVLPTLHFTLLLVALVALIIALLIKRHILAQLLGIEVNVQGHCEGQDLSTGSDHMSQQQSSLLSDAHERSPTLSLMDSHATEQPDATDCDDPDKDQDQDTFDLKMRLKHKNSGRRHTVANIGLGGSLGSGRRGSLGTMSDRSPTNYHYVRKWSVDIVALQNQLENPKSTDGGFPFQELQRLQLVDAKKHKSTTDSIVTESIQEDPESTSPVDERPARKPRKKKTVQLDHRIEEIDDHRDLHEPSSPELLPSIIVNGRTSPENVDEERFGRRRLTSLPRAQQPINTELLSQIQKELSKSCKMVALLVIIMATLIPSVIIGVALTLSAQVAYNLTHVAAVCVLIQSPLTPLLLIWMDTRLHQAASQLKTNLTSWQCVCYCNVGKSKGQTCFARPSQYKATPTVKP